MKTKGSSGNVGSVGNFRCHILEQGIKAFVKTQSYIGSVMKPKGSLGNLCGILESDIKAIFKTQSYIASSIMNLEDSLGILCLWLFESGIKAFIKT